MILYIIPEGKNAVVVYQGSLVYHIHPIGLEKLHAETLSGPSVEEHCLLEMKCLAEGDCPQEVVIASAVQRLHCKFYLRRPILQSQC
jgi:hypothetical protein